MPRMSESTERYHLHDYQLLTNPFTITNKKNNYKQTQIFVLGLYTHKLTN